jgi:septal ring factor EnvC (AmiA/AmiB activator)
LQDGREQLAQHEAAEAELRRSLAEKESVNNGLRHEVEDDRGRLLDLEDAIAQLRAEVAEKEKDLAETIRAREVAEKKKQEHAALLTEKDGEFEVVSVALFFFLLFFLSLCLLLFCFIFLYSCASD